MSDKNTLSIEALDAVINVSTENTKSVTEEYEKKSGIWEKGDNKAWAYFLKLMGYSGYNLHPDEAIKSFESTLR